jgi:hypothetical protein
MPDFLCKMGSHSQLCTIFTLFQSKESYLCPEQPFWKAEITLLEGDQQINLSRNGKPNYIHDRRKQRGVQEFQTWIFLFFTGKRRKRRRNSLKPKGECNYNNHSDPPLPNRIWLKCNFKFFIRKERKNVNTTHVGFFFSFIFLAPKPSPTKKVWKHLSFNKPFFFSNYLLINLN